MRNYDHGSINGSAAIKPKSKAWEADKMRKVIHKMHETAHSHKKHVLASISLVVLALHYVSPEFEAWGFMVAGVITTELA